MGKTGCGLVRCFHQQMAVQYREKKLTMKTNEVRTREKKKGKLVENCILLNFNLGSEKNTIITISLV